MPNPNHSLTQLHNHTIFLHQRFCLGEKAFALNYALKKEMVCWTEVIHWHDVCTNSVVTLKDFFFIYSSAGICASYSYLGFHCEI